MLGLINYWANTNEACEPGVIYSEVYCVLIKISLGSGHF